MFTKHTRDGETFEFPNVPDNGADFEEFAEHFGPEWVNDACNGKLNQAVNNEIAAAKKSDRDVNTEHDFKPRPRVSPEQKLAKTLVGLSKTPISDEEALERAREFLGTA